MDQDEEGEALSGKNEKKDDEDGVRQECENIERERERERRKRKSHSSRRNKVQVLSSPLHRVVFQF